MANKKKDKLKDNKRGKLLHFEDHIMEKLGIKAVKARKDLKNYLQDLLIDHANS